VVEGSTIETDETSRGILTFFDGSTATLFPDTKITLTRMRTPRFAWSTEPNQLRVDQAGGRVRFGAAAMGAAGGSNPRPLDFEVSTPQLFATLTEGSYSVQVTDNTSQVIVRDGHTDVTGQNRAVSLGSGQRTQVTANQPPLDPLPAAQDLIAEGEFRSNTFTPAWQLWLDQGGDGGNVDGAVEVVTLGDRRAAHILRTQSAQNSAITGLTQVINKEVSDFRSVRFFVDIRLHYQELSGGGYLSSEYPLIILLKYRDVDGNDAQYVHAFYYENPDNNPTMNGELVPRDVWIPFETPNLLATLAVRPFYLNSISIYASGWDYESYFSGVRLVAE
jgi:hypothetical protein